MKHLRQALEAGETLMGPGVFSGSVNLVELIGYLDFDFVFLDSEQSPPSPSGLHLEHMVRAAEAANVAPTVRVGELSAYQINNAINIGAQAVWVPHVETAAEAEAFVDAARYPPRGNRGAAPIVRGARYGLEGFDDYRERADTETVLIAIVESRRGVENVAEIAAVEGLDMICFGTFDFAVSLGLKQAEFYGGANDDSVHPDVRAAAEQCLAACKATGTFPATAAWSAAAAELWLELGFQLMLYGLDLGVLGAAMRELRASVASLKGEAA